MTTGILQKENIVINHDDDSKETIIREIGDIFYESGYTTNKYGEAMLEKEKGFNTAIGYGLAIPHGIEYMKDEILKSGIVVMTFPDGIDWGEDRTVKLVVGIASPNDEHMTILMKIATLCESEEAVSKIACMNADEIYDLFA